ncbi:MAG TPA: NAD(P)/FAD-dependent oxidoreductase [Syntrophothermus lipocalidus]|nr:NAD(P)/FAD-dependent oxidoreductase [Syntrophothermus lipocalidus]
MSYVLVGNSAAAVGAIEGIRSQDKEGHITVISEEPHPAYSRPLISYYLEGRIDESRMGYRDPGFYDRHRVELRLGVKAVRLLCSSRRLVLDTGEELEYERLLLATGSKPVLPPINGLNKQGVFFFNRWEDVKAIRTVASPGLRAVVLGAGLTGLKAAEALTRIGLRVTVIEMADRILPSILDEKGASLLRKHLEEAGVHILTGTEATEVYGGKTVGLAEVQSLKDKYRKYLDREHSVESVGLSNGFSVPANIVVVAAGVVPNIDLVDGTDIKCNRGILANEYLETTVSDVYAAGDVTEGLDLLSGEFRVIATLPNAYKQGETAGKNMAGAKVPYPGGLAMNSVSFFGLPIATAGWSNIQKEGIKTVSQADVSRKSYRSLSILGDRLVGFIAVGDVERVGILTALVRSGASIEGHEERLLKPNLGLIDLPEPLRRRWDSWQGGDVEWRSGYQLQI